MPQTPPLDIVPYWRAVQDDLLALVDLTPDDKINWSPKPELWNFRGILLHIASARDGWLRGAGIDDPAPDVWQSVRSKDEIKAAFERTWGRLQRFLDDPGRLDREYSFEWNDGNREPPRSGHWIAFHLLEHDIHHRADLMHYLALLDIPTTKIDL